MSVYSVLPSNHAARSWRIQWSVNRELQPLYNSTSNLCHRTKLNLLFTFLYSCSDLYNCMWAMRRKEFGEFDVYAFPNALLVLYALLKVYMVLYILASIYRNSWTCNIVQCHVVHRFETCDAIWINASREFLSLYSRRFSELGSTFDEVYSPLAEKFLLLCCSPSSIKTVCTYFIIIKQK